MTGFPPAAGLIYSERLALETAGPHVCCNDSTAAPVHFDAEFEAMHGTEACTHPKLHYFKMWQKFFLCSQRVHYCKAGLLFGIPYGPPELWNKAVDSPTFSLLYSVQVFVHYGCKTLAVVVMEPGVCMSRLASCRHCQT